MAEHRYGKGHLKKGDQYLLQERRKIYGFISSHKDKFSVERMSRVSEVSKTSYYRWLAKPVGIWEQRNLMVGAEIKQAFVAFKMTYGSPRIAADLQARGMKISRHSTARIMSAMGIKVIRKPAFRNTTNSNHTYPVVPNVLSRQFTTEAPCQVWVSDITYLTTAEGWLYLTVILDLFQRRAVGGSMSSGMSGDQTTVQAFQRAVKKHPLTEALVFHSDRRIQYAAVDFTKVLGANPLITGSMTHNGNCYHNAVAESFFSLNVNAH